MGMVTYISRKTGLELQADFPLHPSLVSATKADGSTVQLFRSDWDAEYQQQLPKLPTVDVKALEQAPAPPAYEAPGAIPLADLGKVPMSHHAWFQLLHDQLKALDTKISTILAIVEAVDEDEDQDDDTQPR